MSLVRMSSVAVTILALSSTGCFWKTKPPAPPATPPPQTKSTATLKPAPPPPNLETTVPNTAPPPVAVKLPDTPKPPQAKQPARRAKRWKPAAIKTQPTPAPVTDSGPEAPPMPAPKLGDLLTDTQRADLVKKCDQAIQQARAALDQLAAKQLSPESAESAGRARVFIQQAEQARGRDPQTAVQLAQRAEVLARDLLKSVK